MTNCGQRTSLMTIWITTVVWNRFGWIRAMAKCRSVRGACQHPSAKGGSPSAPPYKGRLPTPAPPRRATDSHALRRARLHIVFLFLSLFSILWCLTSQRSLWMPLTIFHLVNILRYSHLRGEKSFDDCSMCPGAILCHKYSTSIAGKVNIEKSCGGVS